uniref:Uncharacterized protein n=1 Tax=Glossina palpalis gambiensis TaxID=67801 RepID=A0A1B0B001_9MUSC
MQFFGYLAKVILPLTRIKLSRQLPIILSNTELISTSVANRPYFLANSKRKLSLRTKSLPEPMGPKCKRVFGTSSTLSAPMGCETSMTSLLPIFMKSLSVLAAGRLKSLSVFCINILRPSLRPCIRKSVSVKCPPWLHLQASMQALEIHMYKVFRCLIHMYKVFRCLIHMYKVFRCLNSHLINS